MSKKWTENILKIFKGVPSPRMAAILDIKVVRSSVNIYLCLILLFNLFRSSVPPPLLCTEPPPLASHCHCPPPLRPLHTDTTLVVV